MVDSIDSQLPEIQHVLVLELSSHGYGKTSVDKLVNALRNQSEVRVDHIVLGTTENSAYSFVVLAAPDRNRVLPVPEQRRDMHCSALNSTHTFEVQSIDNLLDKYNGVFLYDIAAFEDQSAQDVVDNTRKESLKRLDPWWAALANWAQRRSNEGPFVVGLDGSVIAETHGTGAQDQIEQYVRGLIISYCGSFSSGFLVIASDHGDYSINGANQAVERVREKIKLGMWFAGDSLSDKAAVTTAGRRSFGASYGRPKVGSVDRVEVDPSEPEQRLSVLLDYGNDKIRALVVARFGMMIILPDRVTVARGTQTPVAIHNDTFGTIHGVRWMVAFHGDGSLIPSRPEIAAPCTMVWTGNVASGNVIIPLVVADSWPVLGGGRWCGWLENASGERISTVAEIIVDR